MFCDEFGSFGFVRKKKTNIKNVVTKKTKETKFYSDFVFDSEFDQKKILTKSRGQAFCYDHADYGFGNQQSIEKKLTESTIPEPKCSQKQNKN